jgi:DNA-binding winged helix-turn-helix (wHTH) protein/TolB-like protein
MNAPVRSNVVIDLTEEALIRVGGAVVDPISRDATFNGVTERLQPQNLKVLLALAKYRGQVVTRDELIALCWSSRFVGDDVINRAISTLRQFAERAGGFSIETVPRVGYRLIDPVNSRHRASRAFVVAAIVAALVAAIAVAVAIVRPPKRADAGQTLTLALLPPATDSGDSTVRKLAFATRDSLMHALSQNRFAVTLLDSRPAAGERVPDFLMSVDISRTPDKVLGNVRMEETDHHIIVYSHRFEASLEQIWSLPDQIGAQVAGSLAWTVPTLLLDRKHPSDPAVLAAQFGDPAYETVRRLAVTTPNSVVAQIVFAFQAGFGLGFMPHNDRAEALALARRAIDRAHVLAPEAPDPLIAWCVLHNKAQIIECEQRLRQARLQAPGAPWADWFMGDLLKDVGRFDEALDLAESSRAQDQYAVSKISLVLRMQEATGHPTEADALYRQTHSWWPNEGEFVWSLVSGMIDRGSHSDIERLEKELGPTNFPDGYESLSRIAAAARIRSVAAARKVCSLRATDQLKDLYCMLVFAELGDLDSSFVLADQLYPNRIGRTPAEEDRIFLDRPFVNGTEYIVGPGAAAMRRDPRYIEVARRVGLLAYWQSGGLPDFCRTRAEQTCSTLLRAR